MPYEVTIADVVGGTATVTAAPASPVQSGTEVTVTIATIESGKQFKSIVVTDTDGAVVSTTETTAGETYKFTMPRRAVTITVTVEPDGQ